ncbi:MAG TPA: arylesterase [Vicinamibacterales bacterium]|nr:arylesterase [Vicinamibacterales bacterium]
MKSVVSYALVFAVLATACNSAAVTSPSQVATVASPKPIAVLGDSLSVSPSRSDGFPSILQTRINDARLPWTVINAGVRGDTSSGGLQRLDDLLAQTPEILILALGANDGLRGVDVGILARNLSEIITRTKARGVRVLLCGMETPPLHGWNYTLAFHNVFPALAREHNVPLVPFLLAGVALDPAMNMDDMIHPNAAGAKRIADTVWVYVQPLIR